MVLHWPPGDSAMVAWTLVAHIFGLVFWVSGLLVTTIAMSQQTQETTVEGRQALVRIERRFLRAMADPGAALTILQGSSSFPRIAAITFTRAGCTSSWVLWCC